MKIKHIVYTPFTGIGDFNPQHEWIFNRILIYKNYTQKSLLKQSVGYDSFISLLSFRPEDVYNYLIDYFVIDLKFSSTFGGVLYWDDRFTEQSEKNRRLADRLKHLDFLKNEAKECDWIYFTRLDSDDMFHEEAFKELYEQTPQEKTVFIFQNGYIYNKETAEMAEWNPETCPPFYTICFPKDVFFDPVKHLEYMKGWKSHEDTVKIFKPVYMSDRKYCVLVHGKNTTTTWNHRFRGKAVDNNLLNNFI